MSPNDSRSDGRHDGTDDEQGGTNETERAVRGRYDDLEVGDGDVVIYDTENHRAWVQSDDAVTADSIA